MDTQGPVRTSARRCLRIPGFLRCSKGLLKYIGVEQCTRSTRSSENISDGHVIQNPYGLNSKIFGTSMNIPDLDSISLFTTLPVTCEKEPKATSGPSFIPRELSLAPAESEDLFYFPSFDTSAP
ncbi:hypothetical protein FRC02_001854 [Tulasnella sp. 418]|nr:hypothetical protein FRC02_001854 [Tulasnella sp. 418]